MRVSDITHPRLLFLMNPNKRSFLTLLGSLLFACFACALHASKPFEQSLPKDTFVCVKVESLDHLLSATEEGVFADLLKDDDVRAFLKPSLERFETLVEDLKEEDAVDTEKLRKLFHGQCAFAAFVHPEEPEKRPGFIIMAEFSGTDEQLAEAIRPLSDEHNAPEGWRVDAYEETFMGETLYVEEVERADGSVYVNGYALVDGVALLGDPIAQLRDAVARVKSTDTSKTLASAERFRAAVHTDESHAFYVYLNIGYLVEVFEETLLKKMKASFEENPSMLAFGVTPDAIMDALALGALETLSMSVGEYSGLPAARMRMTYADKLGLLKIFAYQPGTVVFPEFIPEDVLTATAGNFSLPKAWEAIEGLLSQISPNLGYALKLKMDEFSTKTGMDIRDNLIHNLGDVVYTVGFVPDMDLEKKPETQDASEGEAAAMPVQPFQPEAIYLLKVRDPEALRNYIQAMLQLIAPTMDIMQESQYLGETIYSPNSHLTGQNQPGFAYAITDEYLMLSVPGAAPLRKILAAMNEGGSGLWYSDKLKHALRAVSADANEYTYIDLKQYTQVIFEMIANVQQMQTMMVSRHVKKDANSGDAISEVERFCDPEALPRKVSLPYFGLGVISMDRQRWDSSIYFFKQSGEEKHD